jgi:Skp family chaperone for outer membrane proteins
MADGERRMLFDIRGRRKHVIRVVYAILALLMGTSLFLVVGPVNIGQLLGNSTTTSNSAGIFDEEAERIEERLHANPNDPNVLISLTRARINAGRAASEIEPTTQEAVVTAKAREEFEQASTAWQRYLKVVNGKANAALAPLVATTAFTLAQNSRSYPEAFEHLADAAAAQRLAAESRPSVGLYTTLAAYEYLGGEKAAGSQAGARALSLAETKQEEKAINKQLEAFRKQGKEVQKSKKKAEKAEKGKGKESLENPLGGLGGGSSIAP